MVVLVKGGGVEGGGASSILILIHPLGDTWTPVM